LCGWSIRGCRLRLIQVIVLDGQLGRYGAVLAVVRRCVVG
jgi:hypothetical protein